MKRILLACTIIMCASAPLAAQADKKANDHWFISSYLLFLLPLAVLATIIIYRLNIARLKAERKLKSALEMQNKLKEQLIQSEKLATLGEMTAGIAHEIQNPLNFVNNFSEVSQELIEELQPNNIDLTEMDRKQILEDLNANLQKINFHGKRADSIVKGMLRHTRQSSGVKEPFDLNSVCDEYMRLAFHGLKAKDKTFNAHFETHLDPSVGQVELIYQEIGRVLLNLINNAFYSVSEKQKESGDSYRPSVTISTKRFNDMVEIMVSDNGQGIPPSIRDKIFQPFFSTKPTGQGTGLGLSMSYEIIHEKHLGELKVRSIHIDDEPTNLTQTGTSFIINIPSPLK